LLIEDSAGFDQHLPTILLFFRELVMCSTVDSSPKSQHIIGLKGLDLKPRPYVLAYLNRTIATYA
jgi:hypothetical protein